VAIGSGLGGSARYGLDQAIVVSSGFPLAIFLINTSGSFLIGYLAGRWSEGASPARWHFWITGFCGGFTTFSTFSWQVLDLIGDGRGQMAGLYAGASIGIGIVGTYLAMSLAIRNRQRPPAKPKPPESMRLLDQPIQFFNPQTGKVEIENVYGEGFLRWAYGNPAGRLTVELAVKRAWFSRWYGWRMDRPASAAKIAPFIKQFGLDTSEFADPPESFESFNAFFFRKLKADARPVDADPSVAVFPADGRHLALPVIDEADNFYIKGQRLDLRSFLADDGLYREFSGGALLISRLCPVDYHRYHFPVSGEAEAPVLLNGPLYSVSPLALRRRLAILWENKRSRTVIESPVFGKVLVMEIGATCVGSMRATYRPGPVAKGQEKGYFTFGGSCVVTLFQPGRIRFREDLLAHSAESRETYARMGERLVAEVG
jgi:phosphatidylserine decarboxylase